ncbi:MAG: CGNR zinc finger domain-containing protein [Candidatus Zixiibacteriota bacterium]
MKNRDKLPVGDKPAPGDLAFVQGFLNLLRYMIVHPEYNKAKNIKIWMVRHGLLANNIPVKEAEKKKAYRLFDILWNSLEVGDKNWFDKKHARNLNRLIDEFQLSIQFKAYCRTVIEPKTKGIDKALGKLLVVVIESVKGGEWGHLKICHNEACRWIFFDSSKNGSGRWCSMKACGSRAKAKAYRARQSEKK